MMERKGVMIALGILGVTTWVFMQIMFPGSLGYTSGFLVIIVTAIGIVVVAFYKGNPIRSPKSILRERYAKGEITKEEYDQMKDNVEKDKT